MYWIELFIAVIAIIYGILWYGAKCWGESGLERTHDHPLDW